jgi:hypothetical protein
MKQDLKHTSTPTENTTTTMQKNHCNKAKRKWEEGGRKAHTTYPDLLLQHPNSSTETYLSSK